MRRLASAALVGLLAFGAQANESEVASSGPKETTDFKVFGVFNDFSDFNVFNDINFFSNLPDIKDFRKSCGLDFMSIIAGADLRSAYLSRGKVLEARPMSSQLLSADIPLKPLAPIGRVGFDFWTISSLTHKMDTMHKNMFFQERDLTIRYGYDWQIADDWRLASDVMRTWVNLPGYRHGLDHSVQEWRCAQRLENPWITPYYLVRRAVHPRDWLYVRVGVQHAFRLTDTLTFTPNFYGEGGNEKHYQQRYGAKDPAWSRYHSGVQALNAMFTLSWKISSWASVYASVQQFGLVDSDARDRVKAKKTHNSRRDLTVGTVGIVCKF